MAVSDLKLWKVTVYCEDIAPYEEATIMDILVIAKDFEEAEKLAYQYFERHFDEVNVDNISPVSLKEPRVLGVVSHFAIDDEEDWTT
ncbi:MAG: hypothetical protein J7K48_07160 [Thermococcus sp.]|uniref:hypothetical protein n=1 Tax=Thermococcus guaymasensis TaxID=110164 RepID=UPI0012EB4109|nr:hypothetical protein [Thermococcus guaymasensis]MCD6524750.1 hypothetical protein [Thermococcus sp.]